MIADQTVIEHKFTVSPYGNRAVFPVACLSFIVKKKEEEKNGSAISSSK